MEDVAGRSEGSGRQAFRGLLDWLTAFQISAEGERQGSSNPDEGFAGKFWGRVGTTVLCMLTLEESYGKLSINRIDKIKGPSALEMLEEARKKAKDEKKP
jgi:hypothetical protein